MGMFGDVDGLGDLGPDPAFLESRLGDGLFNVSDIGLEGGHIRWSEDLLPSKDGHFLEPEFSVFMMGVDRHARIKIFVQFLEFIFGKRLMHLAIRLDKASRPPKISVNGRRIDPSLGLAMSEDFGRLL